MAIHSDNPAHGFQFPGVFEISAMGAIGDRLDKLVPTALEVAGLVVKHETLRVRPSSQGNFVSVTIAFHARSRADYEAAHLALREYPQVRWTL